MLGGRLLWTLAAFSLLAAGSWAEDTPAPTAPLAPPKAKVEPVVDDLHGQKITDNYRWLEDSASPETQEYVRQEMAYTRSVLDPLPGRQQMQERLTQLSATGTIGAPQVGGSSYFYTRREGTQNQPVLLVRGNSRQRPRAGGRQPDGGGWNGRARLVVSVG